MIGLQHCLTDSCHINNLLQFFRISLGPYNYSRLHLDNGKSIVFVIFRIRGLWLLYCKSLLAVFEK